MFLDSIVGKLLRDFLLTVQQWSFRVQNICLAGSVKCIASGGLCLFKIQFIVPLYQVCSPLAFYLYAACPAINYHCLKV